MFVLRTMPTTPMALAPKIAYIHTTAGNGNCFDYLLKIKGYGLKVPPHVGYYEGKGDPDNFIHVFEGAIRMKKWAIPVTCHMFIYILKDTTRVWWNGLPNGAVKIYEDIKRRFQTYFKQHKKQNKTHMDINDIKRREDESVRAFVTWNTNETAQITRLNKDQRIAGFVHGVKIKYLVKFVFTELPKSYDGLLEKAYCFLQAEEIASEGKSITFMDSNTMEKPLKERPWKGSRKKNKEGGHVQSQKGV
nr:putative reverse transcriptase domain-containing protein [Tanacetum cinerariifolium]